LMLTVTFGQELGTPWVVLVVQMAEIDDGAVQCVLLCFIEPVVGGMGPGASSLRDC
jgi:hypothetical protein